MMKVGFKVKCRQLYFHNNYNTFIYTALGNAIHTMACMYVIGSGKTDHFAQFIKTALSV